MWLFCLVCEPSEQSERATVVAGEAPILNLHGKSVGISKRNPIFGMSTLFLIDALMCILFDMYVNILRKVLMNVYH